VTKKPEKETIIDCSQCDQGTNIQSDISLDDITWVKVDNSIEPASNTTGSNGRIPLGEAGSGDEIATGGATVLQVNNTYKMWYDGTASDGKRRIFMAESKDLLNWTKINNAIPENSNETGTDGRIPLGLESSGDALEVLTPDVTYDGSIYQMWYSAKDADGNYRIYYAESEDGYAWDKKDNTIPENSNTTGTNGRIPLGIGDVGDNWKAENLGIVKVSDSDYRIYYSGTSKDEDEKRAIYLATSTDKGLTWTKKNNVVPDATNKSSTDGRLGLGLPGTGDETYVGACDVVYFNSKFYMWYIGMAEGEEPRRIFEATSSDGYTWEKLENSIPANTTKLLNKGKLSIGNDGSGDNYAVFQPNVFVDDANVFLFYTGSDGKNNRILTAFAVQ